ncbi:MAG TPA: hypothetical protein VK166_10725 [Chitinophagaceae bacterium]|nr:hypothetical protein [Chitinophagaceae bacterium]
MIKLSFLNSVPSIYLTLVVMAIMMVFFWIGIMVRKKRKRITDESGLGAVEGALLGLLALLLGFTFSLSNSRYDSRLKVVIEEANDIGTAVLRADLYPDSIRDAFRAEFKNYVDARIEFFDAGKDIERVKLAMDSTTAIQNRLWNIAATLGRDRDNLHRTSQMIPALNAMIDVTTTRTALTLAKVPDLIIFLLFMLCFTSSFMLGYSNGSKNDWVVTMIFAVMVGITIFTILDLDRPRTGVITMDQVNDNIRMLRTMFK